MKDSKKRLFNKGQTIVETALILPVILLLVFGIIEFGRMFNAYLVISNASRDGSRYASIGHTGTEVRQIINDRTSALGTVVVNINPEDARIHGEKVEVTVGYDFPIVTPIVGPIISNTSTLYIESTTAMRVE